MSSRNTDINIATESPRVENASAIASEELPGNLRVKGVIKLLDESDRSFETRQLILWHSVKPMLTDEATAQPCKLNYIGTPLRWRATAYQSMDECAMMDQERHYYH